MFVPESIAGCCAAMHPRFNIGKRVCNLYAVSFTASVFSLQRCPCCHILLLQRKTAREQ